MRENNHPVVFGIQGESLSDWEREFFREARPWGYILFGQNLRDETRSRALIDSLHELENGTPIMVDQEGGRVVRVKPPMIEKPYPSAAHYAALYAQDAQKALDAARADACEMGKYLQKLGININTAPVVDVFCEKGDNIIGDRAYGDAPQQVTALGRAVMEGFLEGGIIPMIKHIPGHGRAPLDSHKVLPHVEESLEELTACDFLPFKTLAFSPMAMTAHVAYSEIDAGKAATVSPKVVQEVIRGHIGFDGVLVTDDLHMKALDGSIAERMCQSLGAGCDLALISFLWALEPQEREEILARLPSFGAEARVRCVQLEQFMREKQLAGFA